MAEANAHSDSMWGSNICHLSREYHGSNPATNSVYYLKELNDYSAKVKQLKIKKKQTDISSFFFFSLSLSLSS